MSTPPKAGVGRVWVHPWTLRTLRLERGLSQKQLAGDAAVTTVFRMERGDSWRRANVGTALGVAGRLGVPLSRLLEPPAGPPVARSKIAYWGPKRVPPPLARAAASRLVGLAREQGVPPTTLMNAVLRHVKRMARESR